jgi:predicted nuclease with TOPRIM domain
MVRDVVELDRGITECSGWLTELEDRKHELAEAVTKIESEIDERTEALKRLIEDKKTKLKKELDSSSWQEIGSDWRRRTRIEQRRLLMDGLRKYNKELESKGAASDIARQTNALHDSTEELLNLDDLCRLLKDLNESSLTFASSNFSSLNNSVSIGKVQLQKTGES